MQDHFHLTENAFILSYEMYQDAEKSHFQLNRDENNSIEDVKKTKEVRKRERE